ncbi:MAG: phenylacetate--CoA ligase [Clostridia bacterium]|jgi:phenylacetate-CoA ligase|nr:phenylacetate--CoA ligase [Clostridia bacterium]
MIWNQKIECMDREQLSVLQTEKLRKTAQKVYENVPFYKQAFDELGVKPDDIKSLDDLQSLPFTVKSDLRDHYPFGLFSAKSEDIVRLHASSGTTGKPTVVGYTARDIKNWGDLMARSFAFAGGNKNSVIQVAYGYGLFTGGLGAHYGAEALGATTIPISGGNTKRQIMLMQDFGTTIIAATPSYMLFMAETMEEMGVDPKSLKLEAGVFGAEPWTEAMRTEIEQRFGILAIDIYGLSEIMGPGVASDCECKCGLHISEDFFLPEIIDPVTLKPLPYGSEGELVFTTIDKDGIPLIRYRTRDITSLNADTCECGRTMVRMQKVLGRSDDMLIIRGVNVFPSQIEGVLMDIAGVSPHYQIVVDRAHNFDRLEVQVEVEGSLFSDEVRRLEELRAKIQADIQTVLGINVKVSLVEPKTIERSMGKAKRVIDNR